MDNLGTLIAGIAAAVILLWIGWHVRRSWQRFLFWLRRRRGRRGEERAIRILEKNGYSVVTSQVPLSGEFLVDGEKLKFDVRPDYLVERDGVQYIAEVKTGLSANPKDRNTRRQLLEYTKLADTNVILLVDATNGNVMKIGF